METEKKIQCVLEFSQSQWLKPFAEFNIQKRVEIGAMMTKIEKRTN